MGHNIKYVEKNSIADELGIEKGDILLRVNGKKIKDVFDYHYLINDYNITLLIQKQNGEEWEFEIEKNYNEDIGLEFVEGLMDDYKSCNNKCIFCFIDQMPPNMRETLYFKDDDSRLSFLQGNYITLTNMKEEDVQRIIKYKLSPINISVHTTNKELRCKMLNNRFAGSSLDIIKKFYDAHIEMNSQIVLCKGINDDIELENTIKELSKYMPYMKSLSVVPVGMTKFRNNLFKLDKFEKDDAVNVLKIIEKYQNIFLNKYRTRFVYASDEWYLTAKKSIPNGEYYEGYGQIENGVGMVRSLIDEVSNYLTNIKGNNKSVHASLATGVLAAPILKSVISNIKEKFPNICIDVYTIINNFFGNDITVAGLLTGKDIIEQLKTKNLGQFLMLPDVLLKSGEKVLLDDITIEDIEKELKINIKIVKSDGKSLVDTIIS